MDRPRKLSLAWAALLLGAPVLITAFQNCGQMFEAPVMDLEGSSLSNSISYSGGCEADLMNLYNQTYFAFLKKTCGSCHTNGPGIGQFGHSDFTTSYGAFKSMTRAAIDHNIVNDAHQPPYTGAHNQATLDSFTPRWLAAEKSYNICTGNVAAGNGIMTLGKAYAAVIASASNVNVWTKLSWNLFSEVKSTTLSGKIPLTVSIEARVATINGVRQGYEFRNPMVKINTGYTGPYRVSTLRLYINGSVLQNVTTYTNIDASITTTTDTNISPNTSYALAVMSNIANTDTFAVEFGDIKNADGGSVNTGGSTTPTTTLPTSVTLAQLLSNDATLGVFKQSCVSCHNSTSASGGLNLMNAAQAKLKANDIYARMTNTGNPMPRAGVLLFEKTELVRIWRDGGGN